MDDDIKNNDGMPGAMGGDDTAPMDKKSDMNDEDETNDKEDEGMMSSDKPADEEEEVN